jgi:cellulose synthase/poly-beta-1,6-N-acetylglucosamine synthase-like glycosyltransferase
MIVINESLIVILIFSSIIILAYAIRSFLFIFIVIIYPALLSLIVINHIYLIKLKFYFLKKNRHNNTFSTFMKNNYTYINNRKRNKISNNKLIRMKKNQISFLANDRNRFIDFSPFISILIASHNEKIVIEKLLSSLSNISYNPDRLEIIIIDDSDDGTYDILNTWQTEIPKLKVIHRKNRTGWKGGALNLGIKNIDKNSDIVLIVDADNILEKYTLKKIAKYFREREEMGFSVSIVQGFPNPIVSFTYKKSSIVVKLEHKRHFIHENINNNNNNNSNSKNWVSKGITFRLYQRNLIEFLAKEKLNLPLQITGSLFAISTSLLKSVGLSNDICEDWDLTLEIILCEVSNNIKNHKGNNNNNNNNKIRLLDYAHNNHKEYNNKIKKMNKKIIAFEPSLVSYTEITKNILTYFKQRMRVSEGHTRGFIIRIIKIIKCDKINLIDKVELFFVGLRYIKYIFIILMISIDFFLLSEQGIDGILTNNFIKISLWLQSLSLIIYIIFNLLSLNDHRKEIEKFEIKYIFYLLGVNIFTIPALAIGSLLGFVRTKGNFYNTIRNE